MNPESEALNWLIFGLVFAIGSIGTAVYYFARYYFKDPEPPTSGTQSPAGKAKAFENVAPSDPVGKAQPELVVQSIPSRDLRDILKIDQSGFLQAIRQKFSAQPKLNKSDFDVLEEILYQSDLGPRTVTAIVTAVSQEFSGSGTLELNQLLMLIKTQVGGMLRARELPIVTSGGELQVWMMVGVNGAGKTTTIGKLAQRYKNQGLKVLVAAADTFRAAAQDQLKVWCERAGVEFYAPQGIQDPSAVAYGAIEKALAQAYDLVLVDTAGRLHTQTNLMAELTKTKRVMAKWNEIYPQQVYLVLDANAGQNSVQQAHQFHEALGVTGVVLTKMDGTARGGVAVSVGFELQLPVVALGIGEAGDALVDFDARKFTEALLPTVE